MSENQLNGNEESTSWKQIDTRDNESGAKEIDLNEMIRPNEFGEETKIPTGAGMMMVKTEELWATCPETGEADVLLSQHTYIKKVPQQDRDVIAAAMEAEGIALAALRSYFN